MSSGIKADEAMQIVSSARGISVPETPEQRRWIIFARATVAAAVFDVNYKPAGAFSAAVSILASFA